MKISIEAGFHVNYGHDWSSSTQLMKQVRTSKNITVKIPPGQKAALKQWKGQFGDLEVLSSVEYVAEYCPVQIPTTAVAADKGGLGADAGDVLRPKINGVKLYAGASQQSQVLATLRKEDELVYLGDEQAGFSHVQCEAGEGWVMPRLPLGAEDIELVVKSGENPPASLTVSAAELGGPAARSLPVVRAFIGDEANGPRVRFGLSPTPAPSGLAPIAGVNEEVRGELEALGYAVPEQAPPEPTP